MFSQASWTAGKTTLIQETLFENGFAEDDDRILIIACEDGEVEYDEEKLKTVNARVAMIESQEDFTPEKLEALSVEYHPDVVFLEYNGTWDADLLYEMDLPEFWVIVQSLATVDAQTFEMYLTNMRTMMMEQGSSRRRSSSSTDATTTRRRANSAGASRRSTDRPRLSMSGRTAPSTSGRRSFPSI